MTVNEIERWHQQQQTVEAALSVHERGLLGFRDARRTAVMVTLQPGDDGELQVLFEHRAKTLRRQPGEISFPGGHVEPTDATEAAAAIREASEELGVPAVEFTLLGALDVFAASSSLLVFPFVGLLPKGLKLKPNPAEVAEVFTIQYERLLQFSPATYDVKMAPEFPDDFPYHLIPQGKNYSFRTSTTRQYFFHIDGWPIWGLTARILHHFLELVRSSDGV